MLGGTQPHLALCCDTISHWHPQTFAHTTQHSCKCWVAQQCWLLLCCNRVCLLWVAAAVLCCDHDTPAPQTATAMPACPSEVLEHCLALLRMLGGAAMLAPAVLRPQRTGHTNAVSQTATAMPTGPSEVLEHCLALLQVVCAVPAGAALALALTVHQVLQPLGTVRHLQQYNTGNTGSTGSSSSSGCKNCADTRMCRHLSVLRAPCELKSSFVCPFYQPASCAPSLQAQVPCASCLPTHTPHASASFGSS
jgi:hypothetical protein